MSGNTSATGGYLTPTTPLPPEGATFDELMQAVVVGITGLPGNMVRPRWQLEPPESPPQQANWCALGEVSSELQGSTYGHFNASTDQGTFTQTSTDTVEVLVTFYGPNGFANAKLLRDGLYIAQNREVLKANGLGFVGTDKAARVPELVNQLWMDRSDITLQFNRVTPRTYNILAILGLMATVTTNESNTATLSVP